MTIFVQWNNQGTLTNIVGSISSSFCNHINIPIITICVAELSNQSLKNKAPISQCYYEQLHSAFCIFNSWSETDVAFWLEGSASLYVYISYMQVDPLSIYTEPVLNAAGVITPQGYKYDKSMYTPQIYTPHRNTPQYKYPLNTEQRQNPASIYTPQVYIASVCIPHKYTYIYEFAVLPDQDYNSRQGHNRGLGYIHVITLSLKCTYPIGTDSPQLYLSLGNVH